MSRAFDEPPFTSPEAFCLTFLFAFTYVGSLYVSKYARLSFSATARPPSKDGEERTKEQSERWRDDPDVIRARLVAVSVASVCSCAFVFGAVWYHLGGTIRDIDDTLTTTIVRLGFSLPELDRNAILPHLITPLLFLGPLYASFLEYSQPYARAYPWTFVDMLFSWQGIRNYVVAPITEEIVFRACVLAVFNLSGASLKKMIMLSPLSFGVAHLHHAWDTYNRYGRTQAAAKRAILMTLFQLSYTTLFGSYASYLFLRTGSIFPPISAHIVCNIMGIPRIGEEVRRFYKQRQYIYLAYVTGILGFAMNLVPWTNVPDSLYWRPGDHQRGAGGVTH